MKWYYSIAGGHTHVRVFMNGGKCGDLCFRNEEFEVIFHRHKFADFYRCSGPLIEFIKEEAT
jgi:hypothetical protein